MAGSEQKHRKNIYIIEHLTPLTKSWCVTLFQQGLQGLKMKMTATRVHLGTKPMAEDHQIPSQ
jgi:hypothetical protein